MNSFRRDVAAKTKRASIWTLSSLSGADEVKMVVGESRREFYIARKLLAASCSYFSDRINGARIEPSSGGSVHLVISLESICPDMFGLFLHWLRSHQQKQPLPHHQLLPSPMAASRGGGGGTLLDGLVDDSNPEDLHWDLVNLHLFAAQLGLCALQDLAMDAIQDLYLYSDWDIDPELVVYAYSDVHDPAETYRLRKWIVAMVAWSLECGSNGSNGSKSDVTDREATGPIDGSTPPPPTPLTSCIRRLLHTHPEFWEEYFEHRNKMRQQQRQHHHHRHGSSGGSSGVLPQQLKNPQLRLPCNRYFTGARQFGYRRCSFHTHRSIVGQGPCPHDSLENGLLSPTHIPLCDSLSSFPVECQA